MISSIMRGVEAERAAVAHVIEEERAVPWYADSPPYEFRGVSPETLSFRMAQDCDLYLLIIFPRYGSLVNPDDTRSVTHQEFDRARQANPYKVEVFIAADALAQPGSGELSHFIAEVRRFRDGYSPQTFHSTDELLSQIRASIRAWQAGGQTGRNAYVQAVANEYRIFHNPVTGKDMDYSATVQLRLRSKPRPQAQRPEWGEPEGERPQGSGGGSPARSAHARPDPSGEPQWSAIASPPQVARELLAQHQHLAIVGDVGSGKSTLLKRLAHDTSDAYFHGDLHAGQPHLPILVTATKLGATALNNPGQPLALVVANMQQEDTRFDALRQTINRTVSEAMFRGEALLLIDGLDEANAAQQAAVFTLLGAIGNNQAVLASRPSAYQGQLAGWQIADLQQLGPEQRRELVLQVFSAETAGDTGVPEPASEPRETFAPLAGTLLAQLRERQDDLAAWAGNPLLLTLIAVQYLRDQRLPENRARIYAFAIEDLQRQRSAGARRYLTAEELDRLLRLLALRMTNSLRRDTTIAQVRDEYLADLLRQDFPERSGDTALVRELLERSGVLQRDATSPGVMSGEISSGDDDRYEFVHISFREYLAACALADLPLAERREQVMRHALHQAWDQVTLLLVNRLDLLGRPAEADALIRALCRADRQRIAALGGRDPTHLALRLATRCAQARGVLLRTRLVRQLRRAWWRVWRSQERHYMTDREAAVILNEIEDRFYLHLTDSAHISTPTYLHEGLPLLFAGGHARRQHPVTLWLPIAALIVAAAFVLLVALDQIALDVGAIRESGWGQGVLHVFPILLLAITGAILLVRLLARMVSHADVRRQMITNTITHGGVPVMRALTQNDPSALVRYIQDESAYVRDIAIQALAQLGERAPLEPLVAALQDRGSGMEAAAQVLGQLGERAPIEPLLEAALSPYSSGREAAAQALGQLRERVPLEPVLAALRDGDSGRREAAAGVLAQLGEYAPTEPLLSIALGDTYSAYREPPMAALAKLAEWVPVEPVLAALQNPKAESRVAAVQLLGHLGARAPIEPLIAALHDDSDTVRVAAARVLGQLGERAAIELLVEALEDWNIGVQLAAAEALVQLGDSASIERAKEVLAKVIEYPDGPERATAAKVLAQLGEPVPADLLVTDLQTSDFLHMFERRKAIRSLAELGERAPVEPLLLAAGDRDSSNRYLATQALQQLGEQTPLEPLFAALRASNPQVRASAVDALSHQGKRVPIKVLLARLHDHNSDVRREAALAVSARDLTRGGLRRLYRSARHPRGAWVEAPLRLVQWPTDLPVLAALGAAQIIVLFPAAAAALRPYPLALNLLSLNLWWQVLGVVLAYLALYALTALGRIRATYGNGRSYESRVTLDALESVMRRQIADARRTGMMIGES